MRSAPPLKKPRHPGGEQQERKRDKQDLVQVSHAPAIAYRPVRVAKPG